MSRHTSVTDLVAYGLDPTIGVSNPPTTPTPAPSEEAEAILRSQLGGE